MKTIIKIQMELTEEYLHKEYIINKKSANKIAAETNWSLSKIQTELKNFGIKTRTKAQAKRLRDRQEGRA